MTITDVPPVLTGIDRGLIEVIDQALTDYSGRSLLDSAEVCDLLLDLRQLAIHVVTS